ncbi:MAG TPA: 1-acyl-sn-glycerol-3-phosphate acyltransferase, partial [Pseudonocardiaceae bacterium]
MAAHPWMPGSPCGPGCVAVGMPTVGRVRRFVRLARAVGVLLVMLLVAPLLVALPARGREGLVRLVFRAMIRSFGARVAVH